MSFPLDKVSDEISRMIDDFQQLASREAALNASLGITAEIETRLVETGEDGEGVRFKPYSDRYAKFRRDKGRQTDYRDFKFENNMLKNIKPTIVQDSSGVTIVEITATTPAEKEKLRYNAETVGRNILSPSVSELQTAADVYIRVFTDRIRMTFG